MRYMGVDFGERRTGIAFSDPEGRIALPHTVVHHVTPAEQVREVARIAREGGAEAVVVGRPLTLAGGSGPADRKVQRFAGRLSSTGLRVVLWDERLTTRQASTSLSEASLTTREQRQVVDQVAAALILQSYLDHINRSNP